jgi:predicted nucleic acid-binding protein
VSADAIDAFLDLHCCIALDTGVVIYAVEGHPKYLELSHQIFHWIQAPSGKAVTSTITMAEALARPYRLQDIAAVDKFYALLLTYPHLDWIQPTLAIADRSARMRAQYNLRTPDAFQAATAVTAGATALLSNDPIFRRIPDLEIAILDEML